MPPAPNGARISYGPSLAPAWRLTLTSLSFRRRGAIVYLGPMASRVTVSRTSPSDIQQRQLIVKLDDEEIATLLYGQTATREVESGRHSLRVDNTWVWKTVEFNLEPEEHAKFQLINRAGRFTWFLVSI